MPRARRLDAPGVTHHVTIRGIEGRDIFEDDVDRLDFLHRLRVERFAAGFSCFAWALMRNHVHLILRTGAVPLSTFMQRLNGGYAIAFNRRYQRSGYLLQDRFHSSLIDDDAYRSVAVRYVFLNPIRAGVVPSVAALGSYPWTGYSELTGRHPRSILSVAEVVEWLAQSNVDIQLALDSWLSAVADADLPTSFQSPPSPARDSKVASVSPEDRVPPEVQAARRRARGWTLDRVIAWGAALCGVEEEDLRMGRRNADEARARAIIAALAVGELRFEQAVVAGATGVTEAGVSRASRRGIEIVREEGICLPAVPPELVK